MRTAAGAGWEVRPLKYVASLSRDVLPENTPPDYVFRYVDIGNVNSDGKIFGIEDQTFASAPSRARKMVRPGDVILSTVRTYLRAIAFIEEPAEDMIVSTGFAVLRPLSGVVPRFLWRALQSAAFLDAVVARSDGVSYPAIPPSRLGRIPLLVPPLDKQWTIVRFLDEQTAKIDALIGKKQRLVGAHHRRFDALAEELIQPHARPVEPLRRVSGGVTVGVVVNPSSYVDPEGSVPFFRGIDVKRFHLDVDGAQRITEESNRLLSKSRLRAGDIVSVRDGDPGTSAVVPREAEGTNCASLLIIRKGHRVDSAYLCYVFNSPFGRAQFRALAYGAAQRHVNVSDAVGFRVPLPSIEEQWRIANRLDAEWRRLTKLELAVRRQLELLEMLRSALITAAVTGQIEVTKAA